MNRSALREGILTVPGEKQASIFPQKMWDVPATSKMQAGLC